MKLGFLALVGFLVVLGYQSGVDQAEDASPNLPPGVIEMRAPVSADTPVWTGPSEDSGRDTGGELTQSETLYVLERRGGWIRFRVTEQDVGWSGWTKVSLTRPK